MTEKLRSIQVLRALAVTAAVTSHATIWFHGAAGVDLFFVISGVIIGTVMRGRSASEFMRARFWRIYPIYWFNAYPLVVANFVAGYGTLPRLATSVTLWPIWGSYAPSFHVPAWTLSFEMLFYSLVALGLWLKRTVIIVPVLLIAIALNVLTANPVLQFVGNPIVLEFCAGLLILKLRRSATIGVLALIAAVMLFALSPAFDIESAQLMDMKGASLRVVSWGLPAALAVYGALCIEDRFGKWADVPVFIGNASYSIYLSHYLLNLIVPIWWPLRVLMFLAVGSLMYLTVEKPIADWHQRRRRLAAQPEAVVVHAEA